MRPRKSKVKSLSTNSNLQSETKRFKVKSSEYEIGDSPEIDDTRNTSVPAVVAALDNHLILQGIFKYFSPRDLRICCEVNEKWRALAGPMIFEYHLQVDVDRYWIKVKTCKGYLNPQIEERDFSSEAETEYLEANKRVNCFISLEFCEIPDTPEDHRSTLDFVQKYSSRVFKLSCSKYNFLHQYSCERGKKRDLELLTSYPNCEEYCVGKIRSIHLFFDVEMPRPMDHLRKISCGPVLFKQKSVQTKISAFLQMIPNLKEIHGVPFTLISEFEKVKKLHLVRSIRFHGVKNVNLETEAMKTMVQLGIKFEFLRIGRRYVGFSTKEPFINRNEWHFKHLLEIGKDTLKHLSLHFDRPENFNNFPETMFALTHLTLKNHYRGPVLFPMNFDFSKCFPKLRTISFRPMTLEEWEEDGSWWGTKEQPVSKKFRKRITNLRCTSPLSETIQRKLLRRFPSVNRIEFVPNIDEIAVDGVISQ